MKEGKPINKMKCKRLKSLKLYQRKKTFNDYSEQENKTNNENKIGSNKILIKNNSCENIINKIHDSIVRKKIFSQNGKKEEKKGIQYEIEKGIIKHPLCLFSKNKFHFGSTKLIKTNYIINENNKYNASTKLSDQNNLISFSNMRRIYKSSIQNNERRKPLKFIKLRKIKELNANKINLYKKYNNDTGLDRHFIFANRSSMNTKTDIDFCSYINNSTKEDINKLNQVNYKNNSPFFDNKKENNSNRIFYSTLNIKGENEQNLSKSNVKKKLKKNKSQNEDFYKVMSKYHFVRNDYLIEIDDNRYLQEQIKIKNFNKNTYNALIRENEKLFSNFRSIVPAEKFSEKFRDPLNNSFDRELQAARKIKEKNIIKKEILPGIKLLKEMDIEIQKRKIVKKKLKGKPLFHKIKKIIIRNVEYLKKLSVSFEEILYKYKRSPIAFSYYKTEELIIGIRNKNYQLCYDILDNFKFIVLDFDYFGLTPLHWAVKVNFFQIIPKLMAYGASVNEQNFMGETPLHISANKNYYESTVLLMLYLASPFIKDKNNKKPIDRTKDIQLIFIFKKITDLHLKYSILKQKNFYENVQKDFIDFISVEFSNQLNPEALSLITNLK